MAVSSYLLVAFYTHERGCIGSRGKVSGAISGRFDDGAGSGCHHFLSGPARCAFDAIVSSYAGINPEGGPVEPHHSGRGRAISDRFWG